MAWWSRLWRREEKAWGAAELEMLKRIYGGNESQTGQSITWRTALQVTTVLRGTRVIADGVATVPLKIMRRDPATGRRVEATDHPLSYLLSEQPNDLQNSLEFRETITMHLVLTGNAFVFKSQASGTGRILELLPFEPGQIDFERLADGTMKYAAALQDGRRIDVPAADMWHLRVASWNSWAGLEPIRLARDAIGLSLATEGAHARMHKNGVQTTGIYSVDGVLTELQHKALVKMLKDQHTGVDNTGVPFVLDRAAKWTQTVMSGVDAEHLATRGLQIEETCRAIGILPIMVGHSDKAATYASAEQMFLAHAVHTIRPWHRRFEASIRSSLLTRKDYQDGYYPKFFDAELLRGAAKDRAEFYAKALGSGGSQAWMTPNDVRGLEDMDGRDDGDFLPSPGKPTPAPAQGA